MTAQISDRFFYEGEKYSLIGRKGGPLFEPRDYGFRPTMMHTACYRGFHCSYEIRNGLLVLTELAINHVPESETKQELDAYPVFMNMTARHTRFEGGVYCGLSLPIPFSGGILLGSGFLENMYVHMGFQKPEAFQKVIELLFEGGRVSQIIDHSAQAAKRRAQPRANLDSPSDVLDDKDALHDWIAWRFSLDYDV